MNTRHRHHPLLAALLGLLFVLVAGCDGGGSVIASGGVGGTGISSGTVTGFGSVIVNGRIHQTDNSTEFLRNGNPSTQEAFRVGDVVLIDWESSDGLTRKARRVEYQRALYGEVTQAPDPATGTVGVVGQTVTADANTLFDDFPSPAAAGEIFPPDLVAGVCVEVSGLRDAAGNLLATRIERVTSPCAAQTQIQGVVTSLVGTPLTQITVSGTTVNVPADITPVELTTGAFVTVKGTYGSGVLAATAIQVHSNDFTGLDGEEADLEGLISDLSISGSTAEFRVSGIPVSASASIEYEYGSFADLANDVRVEVEGRFVGGVLVAEEIEFKLDGQVQMKSILLSADAANGRLTVSFGPDTVVVTTDPLITQFRNDTDTPGLTLADLRPGDYVKIAGFVADPLTDRQPVATLVELKHIAGPSNGDTEDRVLKGPVTDVSGAPESFSALGVRIITSDLEECEDAREVPIDCGILVNSLEPGDIVEVEGTSTSGGSVVWDELELEQKWGAQ